MYGTLPNSTYLQKTVAIITETNVKSREARKRFSIFPLFLAKTYEDAGTQCMLGCSASKNCFKDASVPRAEKTMFVVSLAPVQSNNGTCVALAVAVGVPEDVFAASLETVHWKVGLLVRIGASDRLMGVPSAS